MISASITPQGQQALDGILRHPAQALIGLDFDGTLAPIVPDPRDARPLPAVLPALTRLTGRVGTLAVITGRPAADAVAFGGLDQVPGLIVLGHYGLQRWQDGHLATPPSAPGLDLVRSELPGLLAMADAADAWVEDKQNAIAVHTRRTADPPGELDRIRAPLNELAARTGLRADPGRFVIELRPPGTDKGTALAELVKERNARYVMFVGDDLGDLPAFAEIRALRGRGIPGCAVVSGSAESPDVAAAADLVVDGPQGVAGLLAAIAGQLT
ncbi:MAG TPA: trehalose-phosphatase [Streptosporangiaceae bacterium]|nr:trehalose-phosphatase [Streptosporangiaceae bacterium]